MTSPNCTTAGLPTSTKPGSSKFSKTRFLNSSTLDLPDSARHSLLRPCRPIVSQATASAREAHRLSATLRDFYDDLKIAAGNGPIARLFVFSALPSESAAATIGQVSARDLTIRPQTAALFGLTETELLSLIPQVVGLG